MVLLAVAIDPTELEAAVDEFQLKLEHLRISYEQYFMGIQKREPLVQLKQVVRLMHILDLEKVRNTGLRYRLRNLLQKFNVYRAYWNRTLRAIEMGTYHRDVVKVQRRMQERGISVPSVGKLRSVGAVERAIFEAAKSEEETPNNKEKQKTTAEEQEFPPQLQCPTSTNNDHFPEEEMHSLYRRFLKAKKICGEDTSLVKYETLVESVKRQIPLLKEKYGEQEIKFDVVVRAGRAVLKATRK